MSETKVLVPVVWAPDASVSGSEIRAWEQEAETLVVYQLDLLAQIEQQLRAVQQTMRQIEKLRSLKYRVGPELSNAQREEKLTKLSAELSLIEGQLQTQHVSCRDMQQTIDRMHDRLLELKRLSDASSASTMRFTGSPDISPASDTQRR